MTASCTYPVDAVLLVGPTGSGKSPLGGLLTSRGFLGRRSHHLDFGEELRSIASGSDAASYAPAERDFLVGVLERGLLLENEHFSLAEKILHTVLCRSGFRSGDLLVLNGIPRHAGQAKDLAGVAAVRALVVLDCSVEAVFRRLEENTGGDRTGRGDDGWALVQKKLEIFRERTAPLVRHYEKAGSRIYRIAVNGQTTAETAYHQLSALAAADPPVALVAEPPER
jgi:adenylate kinase family enzyme